MSFRRIVVVLGTPSAASAMTTAIDLARATESELLGLFVENTELLDLAALPFAGEIGFPTAARRVLDIQAMERALRAQARRLQHELGARLAGQPVKWAFEVVRGRMAAELVALAEERDLAVVALPGRGIGTSGRRARAARPFTQLPVPILLVDEWLGGPASIAVVPPPGAAAADVAEAVAAVAPRYGTAALVVAVGASLPDWNAWQRDLERHFAERALTARFRTLTDTAHGALDRLVAREPSRLLVTLVRTREAREALLDVLPWPLLVLPERGDRPR
jgi:hypothetical protein